jgi:hypothetical protein
MSNLTVLKMLQSGYTDMTWFNENLVELKKEFNNSFVAVQNQSIVGSDKDLNMLMQKLKTKKVDLNTVFIEFVSNVKSIL